MPGTDQLNQNAPSVALARSALPNLDVSALFGPDDSARRALVETIAQALEDPGFFYIHNTCVGVDVIESALEAARRFFALPDTDAIKQNVHFDHANGEKGWGPLYSEPPYQAGTRAHLESFDLGQQLESSQYEALGIVPNIWPELDGFRAAVTDYYEAITRLGRAISEVFSELLGQPRDFINRRSGPSAPRTMRMLHYPPCFQPEADQVGISAHTDFECFTLMYQTAGGLELTRPTGEWCVAPSDVGTFTVIAGDMTERLSNGRYRATGHRVVDTAWTRLSMILFWALDRDCEVAPLPDFLSPSNPPRYAPVRQWQHIRDELARADANRADPGGL